MYRSIGFSILFIILTAVTLFSPHYSRAGIRCNIVMRGTEKEVEIGRKYYIHRKQTAELEVLKLVSIDESSSGKTLEFINDEGKSKKVSETEVLWGRALPEISTPMQKLNDKWKTFYRKKIDDFFFRWTELQAYYFKTRVLFESEKFEIRANFEVDPSQANETALVLQSFDNFWGDLGLFIPNWTSLIFTKSKISKKLGPVYMPSENPNVRKPYILIAPIGKLKSIWDKSIMLHERVHSYLLETFKNDAIINQNFAMNEALADFLAAHFLDDPIIYAGENKFVRNIETGEQFGVYYAEREYGAPKLAHANSLKYSNVLWAIRKELGFREMSNFLLQFMKSTQFWTGRYILEFPEGNPRKDNSGYDPECLQYWMVFLLRAGMENSQEFLIESIVKKYSEKYHLDFETIKTRAKKIAQKSLETKYQF